MNSIAITTECVCDLSKKFLAKYGIDLIYFDIVTEEGSFQDTTEINALNVIEYINNGKKARSHAPSANQYKRFFEEKLNEYDEVIHLCISSKISRAYEFASLSTAKMGLDAKRVHIIDSESISACLGMMAIKAAEARDEGKTVREILEVIEEGKSLTYTTLICKNADFIYYCDKVSERVMKLCRRLNLHPVLVMKDGNLVLKKLMFGNYKRAYLKYVKDEFNVKSKLDHNMGFVCYAGCPKEMRESITQVADSKNLFRNLYYPTVGATISVNSGPESFAIQYMKKGDK